MDISIVGDAGLVARPRVVDAVIMTEALVEQGPQARTRYDAAAVVPGDAPLPGGAL